ncbi:peroxisomal membrane protein 11C [Ornithorhynchus anatinus]|uniref:Peroxisomal biosis factor 11 gamma n=1 Tax=Ornithorhynchus anatinus TaxID=9258 RepID=F7FI68_ORNAN|nr:peroxisomal membrane protein 11C [Ornithorhynchus anatinus]
MAAMSVLVSALESYRERDRLIRTLGYGCQLVGGVLLEESHAKSEVGKSLLVFSEQLSHCRTVLRLFDDLSMLAYTKQYGLGTKEEDAILRWMFVFNNLADQLYYPCEHIAWAADAKIIRANSAKWWTFSTSLWGISLLLGIGRSLRIVLKLRRVLRSPEGKFIGQPSNRDRKVIQAQMKSEVLNLLSNLADLSNAIHWMPPGFLWAGRFPPWLVGLMGTISSLIGLYRVCVGGNAGSL